MTTGDRGLRASFRVLRREAEAGAPAFDATLARLARRRMELGRARRLVRTLAVAAVAAAAALALVAGLRWGGRGPWGPHAGQIDLADTHWEAPTDFLLRTPGAELLRTVPQVTTDRRMLQ